MSVFKAISFITGHHFPLYLAVQTTLLQLIINHKWFYVLWNQQDFLRTEHIQAGTVTFPHCTEKKPNCDLSAEVCTELRLLWNVPPQIQLVPFATNEKKKETLVGLFFTGWNKFCQCIHWSQHIHEVIYFFMYCSIHLLELIPPKMTWMNGSYAVQPVCCLWY